VSEGHQFLQKEGRMFAHFYLPRKNGAHTSSFVVILVLQFIFNNNDLHFPRFDTKVHEDKLKSLKNHAVCFEI